MTASAAKLKVAPLEHTHALYRQQVQLLGSQADRQEFVAPEHKGEVLGKEAISGWSCDWLQLLVHTC